MPGGESGESLLAAFGLPEEDHGRLATFYEELGFFRLKKELLDAAGLAPAATTVETPTEVKSGDLPVWETSAVALDAFLARAVEAGLAGLHVECAPGRPFPPEPIALVAALPGGECLAAPLAGDGACPLYTSEAADGRSSGDLGGRRRHKKQKATPTGRQRPHTHQTNTCSPPH